MFSAASKLGFAVSGGALVASILYAFGTGDRSGFALLIFTAAVFLGLAIGVFYFVGPTELAVEVAEVEATPTPVRATAPAPSPWPVGVAAAVALIVLSIAAGAWFFAVGIVILLAAGSLWFGQAWQEHPSWTQAMTERLNTRFVVPFGLPALTIALVAVSAVSFSRIFLAVDKGIAPIIAIVAAIAVLAAAFVIASAERMGRTALGVVGGFAAVLVLGSGIVGGIAGEREFHHAGGDTVELEILNNTFSATEIEIPAGAEVTVVLENNAVSTAHNFAVYTEPGGELVFRGEPVTGPRITTYTFAIDEPGEYHFQSDERPEQLNGTLHVVEGGHAKAGGGGDHGAEGDAPAGGAPTSGGNGHSHETDH